MHTCSSIWRECTYPFFWMHFVGKEGMCGGMHYTASHCNTLQYAATHYCLEHPRRLIEPVQSDLIYPMHCWQHVIYDENEHPDFDFGQGRIVVPFCRNLPCAPGIILIYAHSYRVVRTCRRPYLHRAFPAKGPYNEWLFCEKWPTIQSIVSIFATQYLCSLRRGEGHFERQKMLNLAMIACGTLGKGGELFEGQLMPTVPYTYACVDTHTHKTTHTTPYTCKDPTPINPHTLTHAHLKPHTCTASTSRHTLIHTHTHIPSTPLPHTHTVYRPLIARMCCIEH